jgi:2-oxoglutarate dehydrogenase E2 component (dihydrolipoamide succinyltransferase)
MSIIEIKVPILAESVADATILEWYKSIGEIVQENDKLLDIETDKIVLEIVAPNKGTLIEILKNKGENVLSEEVLARMDTSAVQSSATSSSKPAETPKPAEPAPKVTQKEEAESSKPKTSPAVRKLVEEQGLALTEIPHQGDRVTKADVLNVGQQSAEKVKTATSQPEQKTVSVEPPALDAAEGRPEQRVPMTRLRKRIAERLLSAKRDFAILTTFNEINMKPAMDLRSKYRDIFEKKHNVRLGFMSIFTKAAVVALQRFPVVNASIDGNDVIYHGYYDIGIAVSSPRGLVVPILRDVDAMSFAEIEKNIGILGKKALDSQLSIEELSGGTFSITNGGIFGSMMSTPILNPPQSAILGMHNIVERPVAENGQVVIRPVMYVALSYDHRLIDGRDAVQFLVAIKNMVEDPARLLLEV